MKDGPAKQKATAFVNHAPKSTPTPNKEPCSICLEVPVSPATLDSYCYACILEWSKNSNTCPLCKRRFHKVAKVLEDKDAAKKRQRISVHDESLPAAHKKHKASHDSNAAEVPSAFQFPRSPFAAQAAAEEERSDSDDIQESATVIPDRDLRDALHHPPPAFSLVERLLDLDAWRRIAMTRALNAHVSVLQYPMPTLGQALGRVVSDILSPPGRRRRQREFREVNGVIDLTQEIEVINSDSSSDDDENEEGLPADDPLTNLGLLLRTLLNRRNGHANANGENGNNENNANIGNNNNNNNNFRMNQEEPEVIDLRDSSDEEPENEGDVTSELLIV